MGTVIAKQDRIGARVPHEVYETLCRAAELTGATVNQFLVQAALKEAQTVIEREDGCNQKWWTPRRVKERSEG